ncbi:MAG TPA: site-specific integrase, partial [Acidimicrobiia bacterium]
MRGRSFSSSVSARTDAEAKTVYRRWRTDVDEKASLHASGTLSAFLGEWLDHKQTRGVQDTTLEGYEGHIRRHIDPWIGDLALVQVSTKDFDDLYRRLRRRGVGSATVKKVHQVLHGALDQALRWRLIPENPAALAEPPTYRTPDRAERTPDALEVVALYLEAFRTSSEFATYLWLNSVTGARRGELNGLRWDDVDLDASTLTIRRGIVHTDAGLVLHSTKTHRQRTVDLDPATVSLLREHWQRAAEYSIACGAPLRPGAYVFSASPDGPLNVTAGSGCPTRRTSESVCRSWRGVIPATGIGASTSLLVRDGWACNRKRIQR